MQSTSAQPVSSYLAAERSTRRLGFRAFLRAALKRKTFSIGVALVAVFVVFALFPNHIAHQSYSRINYKTKMERPSSTHIFGTDDQGRDSFSRVVHGARTS